MDHRDHETNPCDARLFPPARKLSDLRKERIGDEELRTILGRAALEVAGRHGYEELTVDAMIERVGISRPVFYRLFEDRRSCYLHGYTEFAEALVERLLGTCAEARTWRAGLRAVLERFGGFIDAEPDLAGGLVAQILAAGPDAIAVHDRLTGRLVAALARADEEAPEVAVPPHAADFLLAAIESTAVGALGRREPDEFRDQIPALTWLADAIFFDRR
ncbi:MAG TPA: helix-turn-helix domain-containing protein [Solirubrobacterales bacterium]|nr:helix-turn-helix domain-containing protein [Solirubrobacterales bacterium]